MIKFFRRIRQRLLSENNFSKYLLYAIGEIFLVVIGILIALQINNWNEEKQNRNKEQLLLRQLLVEYNSNLEQIDNKIFIREEGITSALRLLNYRNLNSLKISNDSVNLNISRLIMRPTFDPELGVSTELINSGNLYLISNSELRNKISAFPSSLSELREEELVIFNLIEDKFIPFLIENFQVGRIMAEFLDDEKTRRKVSLLESSKGKTIKEFFTPGDTKTLLNHPDFEDYLSAILSNTTYTNDQSFGVKNRIEEIITILNEEITKLQQRL
jgi:hypothetical protein